MHFLEQSHTSIGALQHQHHLAIDLTLARYGVTIHGKLISRESTFSCNKSEQAFMHDLDCS